MAKPVLTIRELRQQKGLSPQEVEQRTRGVITRGNLIAIEQGKSPNPGLSRGLALAKLFDMDPTDVQAAIDASVAARAARRSPGRPGRPRRRAAEPAPAMTLAQALEQAHSLCAALEALAAREVA